MYTVINLQDPFFAQVSNCRFFEEDAALQNQFYGDTHRELKLFMFPSSLWQEDRGNAVLVPKRRTRAEHNKTSVSYVRFACIHCSKCFGQKRLCWLRTGNRTVWCSGVSTSTHEQSYLNVSYLDCGLSRFSSDSTDKCSALLLSPSKFLHSPPSCTSSHVLDTIQPLQLRQCR